MKNLHSQNAYFLSAHSKNKAVRLLFQESQPTALLSRLKEEDSQKGEAVSEALAEFLLNQDASCWMTNLDTSGTTYVIHKQSRRNLKTDQVVFLHDGDLVSFDGQLFQALFQKDSLLLKPLPAIQLHQSAAA